MNKRRRKKRAKRPADSINGLTFVPVPQFTDVDVTMGANADRYFERHNLPDVPAKYKDLANALFFNGGALPALRSDIDRKEAMRAVKAWLCSFAPSHESKESTVGYALWVWSA